MKPPSRVSQNVSKSFLFRCIISSLLVAQSSSQHLLFSTNFANTHITYTSTQITILFHMCFMVRWVEWELRKNKGIYIHSKGEGQKYLWITHYFIFYIIHATLHLMYSLVHSTSTLLKSRPIFYYLLIKNNNITSR